MRYYTPRMDVRRDLLLPSERTTHCAYNGTAPHYSVEVGDSRQEALAWHYPFPNPEYAPIKDMIAFYQERIDDFYVDGQRLQDDAEE